MFGCVLFTLIGLLGAAADPPSIAIDGRFDDWAGVEPALIDPADARGEPVDLRELRLTSDGRFVHLLVDFGRTVNIQKLDAAVHIVLDVDGDRATGRLTFGLSGADLDIVLSPDAPPGRSRRPGGVKLVSTIDPANDTLPEAPRLNPYDIGFTFGPTYASRQFEFRIERGVKLAGIPAMLASRRVRGKLVCTDVRGRTVDQSEVFDYELAPLDAPEQGLLADMPAQAPGTLRIMSWNVANGALIKNPEPFVRVLAAIDPDVILLQELTDGNRADQIEEFLNRWLRRGQPKPWQVVFGAGGGNLRCAIASRLNLRIIEPLQLIWYPDWPDHAVRAVGAIVERAGKRLLIVSVHLRAGGRAGSFNDRTRQVEADAIRRAIQQAASGQPYDGLIVAGDFNLVGSHQPLDLVAEGLDADGSALAVAEAYQLDELSNATWSDPREPFVPGRLDYLLYSDAALALSGAFVFDSRDLTPQALRRLGLRSDDTAAASDHFPVVADVQWTSSGP